MINRLRGVLTFANVCSFLALAVAISTGGAYAANTVFSTDIVNGEVKTQDLAADAVTSPKILNGDVRAADLNNDSVTSAKITDDSVQSADLAGNSVGTSEIKTDGVQASEIADNSIDGGEIVDNSMTANDLASSSVGASEIASNAVTGGDVANGSLTMADVKGADNSGAISFNAGAVANGRCADFAIGTPGSEVGDAVVMSLRGDVADGIVFSGVRVAVNDQSIIKMCNLTGGASPAINNLPIRLFTLD